MVEMIIAEKPSVSEKIAKALAGKEIKKYKVGKVSYYELKYKGKKIFVVSAVGHLFTVTEKNKKGWAYPIFDVEWKPSFKVRKDALYTKEYYDVIEKVAKQSDSFVIGCDYDIEGEVIANRVLKFICGKTDAKRMKFSTTTAEDLLEAYDNAAIKTDKKMAEAGVTRHVMDWYWGINLSRALTLAIKNSEGGFKILSSGRVQGPTLRILYDKEKEIIKFISKPYWELNFEGEHKNNSLVGKHKEDKFWDEKLAKKAYGNVINEKKAEVIDVNTSQVKQNPPFPFDLTSLQTDAHSILGLNPKRTMEIAQDLYTKSYISYPRTSSQKLPFKIGFEKILKGLSKTFPNQTKILLSKTKLIPNEGPKQDSAHPAIYPTGMVPKTISGKNKDLYELICHRFFACFGDPATRETMKIVYDINKELFIGSGTRTVKKGWHILYGRFLRLKDEELPELVKGDVVKVKKINFETKETQPPKRYTQASIIKELEKKGLGTKATRATIVDSLFGRNYVEEKSMMVTELGMRTCETLLKYCPEILDEELTRNFEDEMNHILDGKKKGIIIEAEAQKFLTKALKHFKENEIKIGKKLGVAYKETLDKQSYVGECIKCKKGALRIRKGKFGFFISCDRYEEGCDATFKLRSSGLIRPVPGKLCDECKHPKVLLIKVRSRPNETCINLECPTKVIDPKILKEKRKCPKCSTELIIRKSLNGAFFACPSFPKCRHIEALVPKEPKVLKKKTK